MYKVFPRSAQNSGSATCEYNIQFDYTDWITYGKMLAFNWVLTDGKEGPLSSSYGRQIARGTGDIAIVHDGRITLVPANLTLVHRAGRTTVAATCTNVDPFHKTAGWMFPIHPDIDAEHVEGASVFEVDEDGYWIVHRTRAGSHKSHEAMLVAILEGYFQTPLRLWNSEIYQFASNIASCDL